MKLTGMISNNIRVTETKELLSYCKTELTFKNPEYIRKEKMNKWIGDTPREIESYKRIDDDLIIPFGAIKKIYGLLENHELELEFNDSSIEITRKENAIIPYDYQEEAIERLINEKNGVLISSAGSGKTVMGTNIIHRISKKTLWITHTIDLLNQAKKTLQDNFNCKVGTITGGKIDIQDVTFATVQTLSKMDLTIISRLFSVVIIDECHRVCSTGNKLTMFSKVIDSIKARYKIGLTATPHRSDGLVKSMFALIGDVAHEVDTKHTEAKTIKAKVKTVYTNFKLDDLSEDSQEEDGTLIFSKMISEIGIDENRNKLIVDCIEQNKGKSCLVLSDRLSQLNDLKNRLGYGVMIDGSMTGKKGMLRREEILNLMRSGKEKVLFASYKLAKEGLDIPILSRLFKASPVKDLAVVVQSVGRIERLHEEKDDSIVYDFVDEDIQMLKRFYSMRKRVYKKNKNLMLN